MNIWLPIDIYGYSKVYCTYIIWVVHMWCQVWYFLEDGKMIKDDSYCLGCLKSFWIVWKVAGWYWWLWEGLESFWMAWKDSGWSGKLLGGLKSSHIVWNVSGWYGKFQDGQESFWRVLKYLRWFWYFPDGLQSFQVVWKMSECIGKFCGWYCKFSDWLVVRKISPVANCFLKGKKVQTHQLQ